MKNSNFFKNSIIALLPISLGLGVLFGTNFGDPERVDAYDKVSLTTMDIDLNDTTSQEIRDYYADLLGKSASERKGTNLLKNLKPILKDGQRYFGYDDNIWKIYEITDRDWEKSGPTFGNNGTYNASTNIISGYKFGAGKSNDSKNPYVHALYFDRTVDNTIKAWGNHNQDGTGINREHVWAKSHGFDSVPEGESDGGARGDPMHLMAGNGWANNKHSNYFYGNVDIENSPDLINTRTKYSTTVGDNYLGISLTKGSGTVFEPQDCDKGDIARALFYMVARYNNYAGASSGFNGNEPNLILDDNINGRTGTSAANDPFNYGLLSDLLEWNKIDPPDEYEIHRNNLLYTNFTHNRNPFIDFPEWADIAFGSSVKSADPVHDTINNFGDVATITSIDVTTQPTKTDYVEGDKFNPAGMVVKAYYNDGTSKAITGYSWSPSGALQTSDNQVVIEYEDCTDIVNISVKSSVIHVNSVSISPSNVELEIDASRRLTATVLPSDATDKSVTWSSSDSGIVKVTSAGYVTAVTSGDAVITATSKDNDSIKGICTVHVPDPILLDRIALTATPKTSYFVGDVFTTEGAQVTAYYKQGSVDVSNEDVTEYAEFSGFDSSSTGLQNITVSYNGKTTSYQITINAKPVEANTVIFDMTGYGYSNGEKVYSIDEENYNIYFNKNGGTQAAYYVTGDALRVYHETSFTISGPKKIVSVSFTYGSGDSKGDNVYAVDSGTVDVDTGAWSNPSGSNSVTFSLEGSTKGHRRIRSIKIIYDPSKNSDPVLQTISLSGTQKTRFYQNETFTSEGLIVTAHYNNGSTAEVTPTSIYNYNMAKTGSQTVVVSYTEGSNTRTEVYTINVVSVYITDLEFSGEYQTTFVEHETFNHTGLVVNAVYNNGDKTNVTTSCSFSEVDTSSIGEQEVTVTYEEIEKTYTINVIKDPDSPITVSKTIQEIATSNTWLNDVQYSSFELDDVITVSATGNKNSGKYYKSGNNWRLYQTENPSLTISAYEDYKLVSVAITFTTSNNGTLLFKGSSVASASTVTSSCQSVVLYLGNSSDATNGQIRVTSIEVTYQYGEATPQQPDSIELSGTYQTVFTQGDDFSSEGLVTTGHFNNGEIREVTPTSISGYDMSAIGDQEVVVSFTQNGLTKTANYDITVNKPISIESIKASTTKTEVPYGGTFTKEDVKVVATYSDESTKEISADSISGFDGSKVGAQTVTISAGGKTDTITVTVLSSTVVSGITAVANKNNLTYGESFTKTDVTVTATYTDTHQATVSADKIEGFTGKPGTNEVTVFYGAFTFKINVTVKQSEVIDSIIASTTKTEVQYGGSFTKEDVSVTYVYTDGHTLANQAADSISGFDSSEVGKQTIIVNAAGKSTSFDVTVLPSTVIDSIIASTSKVEIPYDGSFTKDDVSVTYVYTDGHTLANQTVDSISGFNSKTVGEQTITVNAAGKQTTISVTVLRSTIVESITASTSKTELAYGESFTKNDVLVDIKYTDSHVVEDQIPDSISGYNSTTVGDQTITVSAGGKTTTIKVTVKQSMIVDHISATTEKSVVDYGGSFTKDDVKVVATYTDGRQEEVACESISGFDSTKSGEQTITVTALGKQTTLKITVGPAPVVLTSITLSGNVKTEYFVGEDFTSKGLVVTAHYSDGSTKVVTPNDISGYNKSAVGEQIITVSYEEDGITVSSTYKVSVNSVDLIRIEVSGDYKKEYEYGENFSSEGLVVTAYYSDGTNKVVTPTSISGFSASQVGYQVISVSYKENGITKTTSFQIKLKSQPEEPKNNDNSGVLVAVAAGGGVVAVGGISLGIGLSVRKKRIRIKK